MPALTKVEPLPVKVSASLQGGVLVALRDACFKFSASRRDDRSEIHHQDAGPPLQNPTLQQRPLLTWNHRNQIGQPVVITKTTVARSIGLAATARHVASACPFVATSIEAELPALSKNLGLAPAANNTPAVSACPRNAANLSCLYYCSHLHLLLPPKG